MTQEEMRKEYYALYEMMANSNNKKFMHTFGTVSSEVMEWAIVNKPDLAQQWIEKLSSIRWRNFLTPKEAGGIISRMQPSAPWDYAQWKQAMEQSGFDMEDDPYYNPCALWVTMCMIMSDSGETIKDYVDADRIFAFVYDLAIDKLTDEDAVFSIRSYFSV